LSVVAGFLLTAAPAANSAGPNIVAVGSDTIQNVDDTLLAGANIYNVHAAPTVAQTVPADNVSCHTARSYIQSPPGVGQTLAPNGSTNGRNALIQGSAYNPAGSPANNGCVAIARSSSGPRKGGTASGQDPTTFEYYAFALDAVSWASPSLNAPAVLTPQQILGIYNCTYTDWSQVGGGAGPIQRFEPQPGSGTRSFFESALLGGLDPTTISTANCPAVITVQKNGKPLEENTGIEINPLFTQKAIIPHSAGQFAFQANNYINPTIDFRHDTRLGGIVAVRSANNTNNTRVTDGSWSSGSTTVTSAGGNFVAGDAGATISGSGIPAGDVVSSVNGGGASVTLGSSGNTRTVTDGVTNKTVPCVNTTAGSTTITLNTSGSSACPASPTVLFTAGAEPAGDVGGVLSIGTGNGVGIPDGATIVSVGGGGTTAVISKAATVTNSGDIAGTTSITLYVDGGTKAVSSNTASFVSGDVGKVISGGNLPAATTVVGISGDGKTAYLSAAATAFNTSGNTWVIDDPKTTAAGASPQTVTLGVSTTSNGSTSVTTVNGHFTSFDNGATVTGAGIAPGTTITVSGTTATLSQAATGNSPSITITDLSENAAFWDGFDQIWVANSPSSGDPRAVVTEANTSNVATSANPLVFPGIRYVWHVIDNASSGQPYYSQALALVGFSPGSVPTTSLCNDASTGSGATIASFGFAALDTTTSSHNLPGSNCRFYQPS
jgi:phosphate transport system substrate-binding protein